MNTLVVFVLSCFFTLISVSYGLYESASLNSTRTLTIATIESAPFVFIERENKSANGFVIDMLNELSRELNFEYRLKYVNKYGQQNPADGTWNGLIGEVMGKRVDFAAAPLTVTSERSKVVDFSLSWMQTGLGVMLQKPIGSGAKLPVHSLKELVADDKFTYGVIEGGSTHRFLKKSRFRLFKEMGENLYVIELKLSYIFQFSRGCY